MGSESLRDCFLSSSLARPEKAAISFLRGGMVETELSYGDLDRDSNRMANTFLDLGVRKGDRVVLYLPKSLGFVVAHLALQKIGAIGVPLNQAQTIEELKAGVVKIRATVDGQHKEGTGFIVNLQDNMVHIVTVAHVVQGVCRQHNLDTGGQNLR